MKFRPLHDRVLIEVLDSDEKTSGGIIIPDTAKEKPQEGKVVAVGSGGRTEDGKTITVDRYRGSNKYLDLSLSILKSYRSCNNIFYPNYYLLRIESW